jgi:mRNA-degrading endonuclease RelE of RelBE toxin-antitoxin system
MTAPYRVRLSPVVIAFLPTMGPAPRQALRLGFTGLRTGQGDIKALGGSLTGYSRLRVGPYRVIFRYQPGRVIECVYLNHRALVYEVFEREMLDQLHEGRARRAYGGGKTKRPVRTTTRPAASRSRRRPTAAASVS